MAASVNDKFLKTGASTVTTLSAPGKALSATSITVGSTTNYLTDTGIVFAIRQVDANGELVAGTYTEWIGTVTSGTTLSMSATPVYGSDQVYPAASTTQVFIPLSSYAHNRFVDGVLVSLDQDGTLKAGAVDNPAVLATDVVETAKIADANITTPKLANSSVTPEKLQSGTGSSWVWQSWTPTWTNVTIGNATVDAKYIQIGKTVHCTILMTAGSTTSFGAGVFRITLPITAESRYAATVTRAPTIGVVYYEDAGVSGYQGMIQGVSTTVVQFVVANVSGTYPGNTPVTSTIPFTWGNGDYIGGSFTYEAA